MYGLSCYFVFSFVASSKLTIFRIILLYCYIWSLLFSRTRSLLVPYLNVSIESIDYILLSFELNTILLISSVETLYFSLLNLCCVFNISFINISLWILYGFFCRKGNHLYQFYFFLDGLVYSQVELLLNSSDNFQIFFFFYDTLFCAFCFFICTTVIY